MNGSNKVDRANLLNEETTNCGAFSPTVHMAAIGAKASSEKKRRSIGSPLDPAKSRAAENDGPGSAAIVYPLG